MGVLVEAVGCCWWWVTDCGLHSFSLGCYQTLLLAFLLFPMIFPALCI